MSSGINGALQPTSHSSAKEYGSASLSEALETYRSAFLGTEEIGRRVASDLAMLGFPVNVWSRSPKPTPESISGYHGTDGLSAMLGETEVLINLLPLTFETRGILNLATFEKMRRGGYLIQVGRGEHLVESRSVDRTRQRPTLGSLSRRFSVRADRSRASVLEPSRNHRDTP